MGIVILARRAKGINHPAHPGNLPHGQGVTETGVLWARAERGHMRQPGRRAAWGILAVLLAAWVSAGCLIQVDHCTNADAAFREARAEAAVLAGRTGRASQVNVLVFDPDDEKLVRIRVPMWLAKKAYRIAEPDGDIEIDFDEGEEDLARHLRGRVSLEELEKAGPGVLVEVEEDGGEQVLVWLR